MTARSPRPLSRQVGTLRDDRLFIVACDDTYAPKQYFGFFKLPRVQIHVVPTVDGASSAQHVLDRLKSIEFEEDDERWLLLDTDHCLRGSHVKGFTSALRDAQASNCQVALSCPCFEIWLLLHHIDHVHVQTLTLAKQAEDVLRATLGSYDKTRLKAKDFGVETVAAAIKRSEELSKGDGGGLIPNGVSTRVHHLWKSILGKVLASQVPMALRDLVV